MIAQPATAARSIVRGHIDRSILYQLLTSLAWPIGGCCRGHPPLPGCVAMSVALVATCLDVVGAAVCTWRSTTLLFESA